MEIVAYERAHLEAILALAEGAEFSSSLVADPERSHRVLSAPGAVALVALESAEPIGFDHGGRWPGYRIYPDGAPGGPAHDG